MRGRQHQQYRHQQNHPDKPQGHHHTRTTQLRPDRPAKTSPQPTPTHAAAPSPCVGHRISRSQPAARFQTRRRLLAGSPYAPLRSGWTSPNTSTAAAKTPSRTLLPKELGRQPSRQWADRQRQHDGVAALRARSWRRENHPGRRKPGVRPAAASLTSAVNVGPNFSGDAGDRCHLRRSSTRGGDLGVDSNTPTNRPASQPAGTKTAALKHHQPNTDTAALATMASANCRCRPASLPTRARPSSSASTGCGCRESAWPPGSGAADASVVTVLRSGVFRRWTGIVALVGAVFLITFPDAHRGHRRRQRLGYGFVPGIVALVICWYPGAEAETRTETRQDPPGELRRRESDA
jgi:hypothetical protein